MAKENDGTRPMTGPWTIYRRKGSARLWMRFEEMAAREDSSPSQMLETIVRLWLDKNYVKPGPHNVT